MKKILTILIASLLWCNSSSADTPDNILKWISKYNSLTADKTLIFCIPVWENHKDGVIDLFHSVMIKDLETNQESIGMNDLFIKTFGSLHQQQTIAYLSMTKDLESYLKGKSNIRHLDLYDSSGDVFKLYTKESVDLFHHSAVLLKDTTDKYGLFQNCNDNYGVLLKENERIKEIKEDIRTSISKEKLLEIQAENWSKKLQLKIKNTQ